VALSSPTSCVVRIGKTVPTYDFGNVVRPVPVQDLALRIPAVSGLLYTPIEAARAVQILPLGLELAVAVEYLDAMVLSVGDVDPAIR
jgi:hypothetical protein